MSNILNLIRKSKQLDPNKSNVLTTVLKMDEQSFFFKQVLGL